MGKLNFNKLLKEAQFHGAVRLSETRYSCYWALALLVLFGTSLSIVYLTVVRFMQNPTYLVQYDEIQEMALFPSVMVCPEIEIQEHKIDAFLNKVKYPPKTNARMYKPIMRQIAAFYARDAIYRLNDLMKIEELLNYNNIDLFEAGHQLYTSCRDTLIRCRWSGKVANCSELFHMELTGDGYCCVFNGRSWHREMEHFTYIPKSLHRMWHTNMYGHVTGLMLAINQKGVTPTNVDLEYKWLALQSSQHYVETSINGTPLNIGAEQWAAYHYYRFQIADEARSLSDSLQNLDATECNCPQACDVGQEYVETSSFDLVPNVPTYDNFYDGLNFSEVTIVRAYIGKLETTTRSRESYFSAFDFFAQLGGVVNVFFGCSVLTMLELVQLGYRGLFNLYISRKNRNQRKIVQSKRKEKKSVRKMGKY
ncbi:hypothetical protein K1T71_004814 [Dendrolimus kikuchii]|uniref:Uncharacterized protein n=1 Tax=Dendrolimus kikuchii TaxID=765133 RepID=A0ACC1D5I3_9NEOP|nr:hypothetical protein K1T71_004814 [Dendrolimus kikuchii]